MAAYEAVIGLEVHVQLATASKLFCSCSTRFGQPPNTNVCEVCAGMPGALPVPNRQAVHYAALVGLATNCAINRRSIFARKNYFYPDLPAGYQISQFDLPICEHGHLDIVAEGQSKRIGITRIHMENDAGKNIHAQGENASYVDLNRAGTPLVEIVSEPDMRSAAEAVAYLKTLYGIVTYLGVCDGNMEEGSFRCDANVSLRPVGATAFGTRTELKNLNSFRNVQRAIEYEIARQQDVLDDGDSVVQQGRGPRLSLLPGPGSVARGNRSRGTGTLAGRTARIASAPCRSFHGADRPARGGSGSAGAKPGFGRLL